MRKAALHNLGCKVNSYETEAMGELLSGAGYEIVSFEEKADVYVINTCTVTNMADRKSRQMLHKAKKKNPDAVVVAVGCYVQEAGEELLKDESVDIVIGNNRKNELVGILEQYFADNKKAYIVPEIENEKTYENMKVTRTAEHTRAYIKVQDGCNQFCAYCIIPFARGRVRSREKEDILREIRIMAASGYREIVLTGIHLSSYGMDFARNEGEKDYLSAGMGRLLELIDEVSIIPGIERIRLGSLEPRVITEEFVRGIAANDKICPHFHLSLQSGCDTVLERMNRHYSAGQYYEEVLLLRKYFDDPAITTDIIVGFPGETEEEFGKTVEFVKKVDFFQTHIFKYSVRQGTKAASMPNQVPEKVKTARSNVLMKLSSEHERAYYDRHIGRDIEVLLEEPIEVNGKTMMVGHSREYLRGLCENGASGDIVKGIYGTEIVFLENVL